MPDVPVQEIPFSGEMGKVVRVSNNFFHEAYFLY